jgi:GT2 family glycosyltransferase
MKRYPKISIITVNYNGEGLTRALLLSLERLTYPETEIWVVDNGSETPPFALEKEFPQVSFIYSEQNLGFAGGNNLAVRKATGEIIYYLNNDTEVDPGFLEPLADLFAREPGAGIISSKLLYHAHPDTLQFAGSHGMNEITGRAFAIGWGEKDGPQYDKNYLTALAHGAGMAVRKSVFERIGLMYEGYFLYYEELDFCTRARKAGFDIWYCGESRVYHKESMSVGKNSALKIYYLNRNRMLYIRRNIKGCKKWMALLHFLFLAVA